MMKKKEKLKWHLRWFTGGAIIVGASASVIANLETIENLPTPAKLVVSGGYIGAMMLGATIRPSLNSLDKIRNKQSYQKKKEK